MKFCETVNLLREMAAVYPRIFEGGDANSIAHVWTECLEDVDARAAHKAFIRYYRDDTSRLPPTPGMLLEYLPEKDRLPFLGWDDDE